MNDHTMRTALNYPVARDTYKLVLKGAREFAAEAEAGCFAHIRIPRVLARRPISIADADPTDGTLTLIYAVKGEGTRAMSELLVGQEVLALGPLGKGFPVKDYAGKTVWLLGGGLGVAPLLFTARKLYESGASVRAYIGFKNSHYVYGTAELGRYADVRSYTDDGSFGIAGFAVKGMLGDLAAARPHAVFACGPKPMYQALAAGMPQSIPCYISLEERMGCGVGACLGCACEIRGEDGGVHIKRVCADGPVFSLREVVL